MGCPVPDLVDQFLEKLVGKENCVNNFFGVPMFRYFSITFRFQRTAVRRPLEPVVR
jgi:hypothetical protein